LLTKKLSLILAAQLDTSIGTLWKRLRPQAALSKPEALPRCRCQEPPPPPPAYSKQVVEAAGQHSRSDSVKATGLQLQQAVPPVLHGHTEVVDGAPKDHELVTLQGKVCCPLPCVCSAKTHRSVLQPGRGQVIPVIPAWGGEGREETNCCHPFGNDIPVGRTRAAKPVNIIFSRKGENSLPLSYKPQLRTIHCFRRNRLFAFRVRSKPG
jgi:hypothetical protein